MVTYSVPNRSCLAAVVTPYPATKQLPPITTIAFPAGGGDLPMDSFSLHATARKDKVVVVMGATGTGKSRLSLDLAAHFPAEVINSDKMQVYKGLNVVTNKITDAECAGVPHHLLGIVDPDAEYTASEFRWQATHVMELVHGRGRLPIIAGGSNSYIEALVDGEDKKFRSKSHCCFLWVDVALPVLHSFVSDRVDRMVEAGLVDEVRAMFRPDGDYSRGIRKAIGVPEMDEYFRAEACADRATRARLLKAAIKNIKANTCKLAVRQLQKIHRLQARCGWAVHRLDATEAFLRLGHEADEAWERLVAGPSVGIVRSFLYRSDQGHDGDRDVKQLSCGSNSCGGVAKCRCVAIDAGSGSNCSASATAATTVAVGGTTC